MSKKVSYGGILLSINCIILYLINIIPTNTLFFMMISSFLCSILVMEFDLKTAFSFCVCCVIMSFFVISNKIYFLVYTLFFSFYGIIKYIFESKSIIFEYVLKFVYANLVLVLFYNLFKSFVFIKLNLVLVLIYQILFLIYDRVYSSFIVYYYKKLKPLLKIR